MQAGGAAGGAEGAAAACADAVHAAYSHLAQALSWR